MGQLKALVCRICFASRNTQVLSMKIWNQTGDHPTGLVLEQIHSNASQCTNSPFGVFSFITLVNIGEEFANKCRVSVLDDGLPSGSH